EQLDAALDAVGISFGARHAAGFRPASVAIGNEADVARNTRKFHQVSRKYALTHRLPKAARQSACSADKLISRAARPSHSRPSRSCERLIASQRVVFGIG